MLLRVVRAVAAVSFAVVAASLPVRAEGMQYKYPALPLRHVLDFLVYDFGLAPGGVVSGDLHSDSPKNTTFLVMFTHAQWQMWRLPTMLPGGAPYEVQSYIRCFWRAPLVNRTKFSFHVDAPYADRYYFGILNAHQEELSIRGELSLVNPGGGELPLEFDGVPEVLLWCGVLFFAGASLLISLLATTWRSEMTAIHVVMMGVVALKGIVLFLHWRSSAQMAYAGSDSVFGRLSWQVLDKLQEIAELMMFLLIALGWRIVRPTLNFTEIRFALGMSVISCYLGIFEVTCTTNPACSGYQLSRYVLHSLCYLVIIVAMNFNLLVVHAQIVDAPASPEAGKQYRTHEAYKLLRKAFLVVLTAPTLDLFLRVSAVPWYGLWAYVLLQNLRSLAIYACVAWAFRPGPTLRVLELAAWRGEEDESSGDDGLLQEGGLVLAAVADDEME